MMELPKRKNEIVTLEKELFPFSGNGGKNPSGRRRWERLWIKKPKEPPKPGERYKTRAAAICENISAALSVLIFCGGSLVLAGWALDIPALKSVLPNLVTMKVNTALCFILLGLSLWLLQAERIDRVLNRRIARGCSFLVILISSLTLVEYVTHFDLGIDQCLFKEAGDAILTVSPGRMASNTVVNFFLAGSAFFLMTWRNVRYGKIAQFLMIPLGVISLLSLTGYLYDAPPFYFAGRFSTAMALHTTVLFLAIFFGGMFCRANGGLMRHLTSDRIGGRFLRWILPLAVFFPLLLGWLKVCAEDGGLFPARSGVAMVAIANLFVTSTYIFVMGILLNKRDARAQAAKQSLEISERSYRSLFETAKDGILILDGETGEIVDSNPFLLEITGYALDELFGKKLWEAGFLKARSFSEETFLKLKDKEYVRHENFPLQKKSGEEILAEAISNAYEVEGVKIIQFNIRDVTDRRVVQRTLREMEEKYRQLFESVRNCIVIYRVINGGEDFLISNINLSAERLEGVKKEAVVGKSIREVFPGIREFGLWDVFKRVYQTGKPEQFPLAFYHDARISGWRENYIFKLPEDTIVAVYEDVTAKKKVEEDLKDSKEYLERILGAVADPIFVKDREHRWVLVNEAFCHLMGRSRDALIGKSDYDFFSPKEADIFWEKDEEVLGRGTTNINEEELTDAQGVAHAIVTKKTLWKDTRGETWIVGVIRDVTDFRKLEKELREQRDHLDELVVERTMKLEETNQKLFETALQLAKAGKAKSDFLANMSHELRTPLNSILGFSEVLYDQTFGPMNEKQKQYAENVLTSGRHLLSLINEVLDLAKVEAGKMKLELGDISLSHVIEEAVVLIKEAAFKKNLGIKIEVPATAGSVLLDERKIKQVLCNLLFNSVKFTPSGGNLGVRVQPQEERIEIAIWDTGIGIDRENLERIFEAFSRVESPYTQETEGTGLGLALCRKMVELHGGRIWAESSGLGLGTTVRFFLPVKNAGKQS